MYDVIVIGGGIIGSSIAYHLISKDLKTLLIDRNDPGKATDAGAGIVSPATSQMENEAWYSFAVKAGNYYPQMIKKIESEIKFSTGYAICEKLILAASEDELEAYKNAKKLILSRQQRLKTPHKNELYVMDQAEIYSNYPMIKTAYEAIYYKNAARVDGRLLNKALKDSSVQKGLEIINGSVNKLLIDKNNPGVLLKGKKIRGNRIVIAGGAWSQSFAKQLQLNIPIQPQRGQILHLKVLNTDINTWPITFNLHGHYLVPWSNNIIVAGATRETNSGFNPVITVKGVQELLFEATRIIPELKNALLLQTRVGLRPKSYDNLPIVGPIPHNKQIILATGHGATGLSLGPYTGIVVADIISNNVSDNLPKEFRIDRFKELLGSF